MAVKYSIVIPVYNEEESVGPLEESITSVMDSMGEAYEVIFVNDGSTDGTLARLKGLKERDPRLNIVTLERNSGQTAALRVGFQMAAGGVVISMDGDLQNDARDIPLLLGALKAGSDVVCGWRRKRHDSLWKKAASKAANAIQNAVFNDHIHDISCTLRAYRREALKELDLSWNGAHRFIPYLLLVAGKNVSEVEVNHHPRRYGKSKYRPTKIFKTIKDFLKVFLIIRNKRRR